MPRILKWTLLLVLFAFTVSAQTAESAKKYQLYWPQWRGPLATGVAPHGTPPVTWSEDNNIRWKVEIPGKGHATPIIWEDQVFLLTAVETDKAGDSKETAEAVNRMPDWMKKRSVHPTNIVEFTVIALDRKDGSVRWQKIARAEHPHEGTHSDGTWASNSPVTDGEHLFAHFGSRGLYCYDMAGNLKWQTDLGNMITRNGFGEGSSPALHEDVLVVNWDHEGDSFIVALDKRTGEQLWKKDRDEVTSWSTPVIVEVNGRPQVVINATGNTRGYDLKSGEVVWEIGGMTTNTIPSPVYEDGILYVMSGFRGNLVQAIQLARAAGEITGSDALLWQYDRDTPYVPSPVLYDSYLYFLKKNSGILSCFDARTGQAHFGPERLAGVKNVYASPVGANGRIYVTGRQGNTIVLKVGPKLEILASNSLDDSFDASPAIVGGELYLRGHRSLYCISEK